MQIKDSKLCILGFGTLGQCIVSGILESSSNKAFFTRFIGCVKSERTKRSVLEKFPRNVECYVGKNVHAVQESDIILLACKPYAVSSVLGEPGMSQAIAGKILISIATGVTIQSLSLLVSESTILFRIMPNTPVKIRKGTSIIYAGNAASEQDINIVEWIFKQLGETIFLNESDFNAATALVGSGPAFVALYLEAMVDGAVMMGIQRESAERMAALTMEGTAAMFLKGNSPSQIRNDVATPGGCTIGGLLAMEDGKIRSTVARAIQKTTEIAKSMGQKTSEAS